MTVKLNTSIPIPVKFLKDWQGSMVFIGGGKDTLIVKKIHKADQTLTRRFQTVGRKLKRSNLDKAILAARK